MRKKKAPAKAGKALKTPKGTSKGTPKGLPVPAPPPVEKTIPNPMEVYLSTLLSQGGKRVAVLDFLGSLCPITLGHVQSVVEAHEILTGKATPLGDTAFQVFDGCVALITVNDDSHVSRKLASKGEAAMSRSDRLKLCELATAEYPWIHSDVDFHEWSQGLQRKFVDLDFVVWHLNGADDVSKYSKWNDARADSRYITMGRPGYTQEVLDGMRKSRASSEHFIVGREMPVDISSTEARAALTRRDMIKLATLLHPSVTAWCLTKGPWRDTNPNASHERILAVAELARRVAAIDIDEPVSGAGFGTSPKQLSRFDYGCRLPTREHVFHGAQGVRQHVLLECLERLEDASPTACYHKLAQQNLRRWSSQLAAHARAGLPATPPPSLKGACTVHVLPGDWGQVTLDMTRKYGVIFASLNMANAYRCGGGYTHGKVAQEENMFRRTDCHFSLERNLMDGDREDGRSLYSAEMTLLISGGKGRVYLDKARPRVCIRGPEDSSRDDLGYPWLADDEVFPFYELRAAAVDLRGDQAFDADEASRRVAAQLDTLIEDGVRHAVLSAFGCGAFLNPADQVARIYRQELHKRATHFDVIAFAIFHAGYGPDNFKPFEKEFAGRQELFVSGGSGGSSGASGGGSSGASGGGSSGSIPRSHP